MNNIIFLMPLATLLYSADNPGLLTFEADNNNTLATIGNERSDRMIIYTTIDQNGKIVNLLLVDRKPESEKYKEVSLRDINIDGIWDLRLSCLKSNANYEYELYDENKWIPVDRLEDGKTTKDTRISQ